jgi:Ca2+-binding EF-hand superfamily protein
MHSAEEILDRFDQQHEGELSRAGLGQFVESLRESMGCSLAEVSQLLVQRIAFSQNGEQVLQDHVANLIHGSNGAIVDFQEAITEVRMMLLFDMFKHEESGVVPFHIVLKHLLSSGLVDKVPKEILLQLDRSSRRVMDYPEFADLIVGLIEQLASTFPKEVELHDVVNDFTMSVLYSDNDAHFDAIFSRPGVFGKIEVAKATAFEYEELHFGRIGRLFTIFDVDNDGTIGPHEFVLGMRSIQLDKSLDDLISESINVLFSFDKDGDLVLNRVEFGKLFSSLATTNGVDLQDMLGYMLVKSALHDSSDAEKKYIATVLNGDSSFGVASTMTKRPTPSRSGLMTGLMAPAKVFASMCA